MTAVIRTAAPFTTPSARSLRSAIDPVVRPSIESASGASIRQPEAVYRRRRAVVGTVLAVLVAVAAVATHDVLAGSGGDPASAAVSLPARTTVIAQPGDTLWSIARAHRGEASLTRYLDTLVDLNGGPTIQVGQTIVLP